ncbi:MAG: hypothetical protein DA408_11380 [Bacteroidetes bacterium]|nr:MAG: hypothetical protein DA408_11380 [Bacteroidota bacterium]
MKHKIFIFSIASLLMPLTAFAHGGHGAYEGWGLVHFLTTPVHAAPLLLAAGIGIFMYFRRIRSQQTKH